MTASPTFEQLASPRIFRGTPATIWLATYHDGEPTAPATPAPTVAVVNQSGTTVASGTAVINTVDKRLEYNLTPAQTALSATLTATWSSVVMVATSMTLTSEHEIAGDRLITIEAARAFDDGALKDANKYPNKVIWSAADQIWDAFEDILGYSMGRRINEVTLGGDGETTIWLPYGADSVRTIETRSSTTWTAFTADELADTLLEPSGRLTREALGYWPVGTRNVRVTYESGPIVGELKRAALIVLKSQLIKSLYDQRATSMQNELGQFQLKVAGTTNSWFGLPDADAVLARRRAKMPGFA